MRAPAKCKGGTRGRIWWHSVCNAYGWWAVNGAGGAGTMGGTVGIFNHGVAQRWGEQVGELDVAVVEEAKRVGVEA